MGKGSGQGLAMVYGSVVHNHGGTIDFESEVGQGTTFILRLPIVPASDSRLSSTTATEFESAKMVSAISAV
jgi:nitrogen-specific signal transduction histidine kinase